MARKMALADLSFQQLKENLVDNYSKIGIHVSLDDEKLIKMCVNLFEWQKDVWVDAIDTMFEMYANNILKCTGTKPDVSSWFFKELKTDFFSFSKNKKIKERGRKNFQKKQGKGSIYPAADVLQYLPQMAQPGRMAVDIKIHGGRKRLEVV